jgi:hypothetical protein
VVEGYWQQKQLNIRRNVHDGKGIKRQWLENRNHCWLARLDEDILSEFSEYSQMYIQKSITLKSNPIVFCQRGTTVTTPNRTISHIDQWTPPAAR